MILKKVLIYSKLLAFSQILVVTKKKNDFTYHETFSILKLLKHHIQARESIKVKAPCHFNDFFFEKTLTVPQIPDHKVKVFRKIERGLPIKSKMTQWLL